MTYQTSDQVASAVNESSKDGGSKGHQTNEDRAVCTLYVGDLALTVDEQTLWSRFSAIGPIITVKVCKSRTTGQSLGYGYVNFQHAADAEKAMDRLNYDLLQNRPMRIMWAQRDPSKRRLGIGNVFVKNLHKSITTRQLYDTFLQFGSVMSCKIVMDDSGQSLGFGFVHFLERSAADLAISQVNGMIMKDKKVYVGNFKPKTERLREMDGKEQRFNNIFVKNFGEMLDDKSLTALFAKFGSIISAKVMCDAAGKSKGFGFVSFHDPEHARKAAEEMSGYDVGDGSKLYISRAQKKQERLDMLRRQFDDAKKDRLDKMKGINLYVKHFSKDLDDNGLYNLFAGFGTITSCKVMKDPNGESRSFGFVCFSSPVEATRAMTELNGKMLFDRKALYVNLAQNKDERQESLRLQVNRRIRANRQLEPVMPAATAHFSVPQAASNFAGLYQNQPLQLAGIPSMQQFMQQVPALDMYQPAQLMHTMHGMPPPNQQFIHPHHQPYMARQHNMLSRNLSQQRYAPPPPYQQSNPFIGMPYNAVQLQKGGQPPPPPPPRNLVVPVPQNRTQQPRNQTPNPYYRQQDRQQQQQQRFGTYSHIQNLNAQSAYANPHQYHQVNQGNMHPRVMFPMMPNHDLPMMLDTSGGGAGHLAIGQLGHPPPINESATHDLRKQAMDNAPQGTENLHQMIGGAEK